MIAMYGFRLLHSLYGIGNPSPGHGREAAVSLKLFTAILYSSILTALPNAYTHAHMHAHSYMRTPTHNARE